MKFWYPSISRERLKLETSNLACRFNTRGTNEENAKLGQRGSGRDHVTRGVARSKTVGWTEGTSRTHNGGLGAENFCPGVQGQSPWSGVQGAKPPEAESILPLDHPNEGKICHFSLVFLKPPSKPKIVLGMDRELVNFCPGVVFLLL